ncbi:putative disease resistance protein RGA1 [Morella rubra]|uniref:Putative disease resistance protein RGA1 n=1 Tax=Morella rubra TaxID=262757 RepID=A0A6A1VKW3_9ROSI|nr:putative disease resistance protein RGA1 [Morella rubra]
MADPVSLVAKPHPVSLVAKPLIEGIIKIAFSLIKEEYSLLHGVKEDVEKLASNLTAIKGALQDAEKKQLNQPQLKDWLRKLQEAAFDAEDVLDTFATEATAWKERKKVRNGKFKTPLSTLPHKHDAALKIKDISRRLDIIAKEKENFHLRDQVDVGRREIPNDLGFHVNQSDVVGRENDKESIVHMLLSNEFDREGDVSVIPIIGMGGLGKTTLAQVVFNDERVKGHFESRMWVCVTVQFELTRILKEMIQFHSKMAFSDSSTSHLQSRLLDFLTGQRFLLVLDDVWTEDYRKWDSLKGLLKKGAKGSRVLVTSRITKVNDIIGTQPPHRLGYLPEEECWSLFSRIALSSNSVPGEMRKDLEPIGREIVRKCKGLPLAIKAIGGLLLGHPEDINKWRQIQNSEIWEIEEYDSGIDKLNILGILKLSFDHLPSYLKPCFAYCSIFPKAYVFYKKELVKYWMAQGFIQARGRETMEETAISYFDELLVKSFFQLSNVDNKDICSMHDLIHDLAVSISNPSCCLVDDNATCSLSESHQCRHVSLLGKDVEKPMVKIVNDAPKLRSLLLPTDDLKNFSYQALEKVFHTLKYLRMLDLSSSTILELSKSIEDLKLLRYLDLSRTEIKALPNSICNLYNLQTLKLLGCLWLSELPKDLGNLVNLRHLEVNSMFWFKLSMLPPRMGKLTNLQNLPAFRVGERDGFRIGELKNMEHLSGALHISKLENAINAGEASLNDKKNLHKLVLEWSEGIFNVQDEAAETRVLEDLQPHPNLKELQIFGFRGNEFPGWMRQGRLQNLVSVTLNGCLKCKTLTLGDQLHHLQQLCVKDMQELEKWPEVECSSLGRLKFSDCPKLTELPGFFPNLRVLKVKSCDSLKRLPVTPSLMFLRLVDNLVLEEWPEALVELHTNNDQGQPEIRRFPSTAQLLELKVISCPKLQRLPRFFFPQKLEISECQSLTTFPPPQHSRRLQHLALDACHDGTLVRTIPDTVSLYSLVISSISNLASLPKWPQLPGLKALYICNCKDLVTLSEGEEGSLRTLTSLKLLSIRNCPMLNTLNEELPSTLECLTIGSCPRLQSLGPKEVLMSLDSLKDLYIEDCPMIQSLPEDGLPSCLQHLKIQACPLLAERCRKEDGGGPDWAKIAHIPDLEIDPPSVKPSTNPPPPWYRHFLCCKGGSTNDGDGAEECPN